MPPVPRPTHPYLRWFWGLIHRALYRFSVRYYCKWTGVEPGYLESGPYPLPFGLILKWGGRATVDEALATQVCYAAGLPAPRILCYGDHPIPSCPFSMLMLRLPGEPMPTGYPKLTPEAKATVLEEFKMYFDTIRQWKSPWGEERICSITGGRVVSQRVPAEKVGPCEDFRDFFKWAIHRGGYDHWPVDLAEEARLFKLASRLPQLQKQRPGVRFSHGDIAPQQFLIDDQGHITGFLDLECAGWYPQFWDWVLAEFECYDAVMQLSCESWGHND